MRKFFCVSLLFFSIVSLWSQTPKIRKGVVLFSDNTYLEKNVVSLNGEWEIYINKLITTAYNQDSDSVVTWERNLPDEYISVPNFWKDKMPLIDGKATSFVNGSYRLLIAGLKPSYTYSLIMRESPGTASIFYVNNTKIFSSGVVAENYSETKPQAIPCYMEFTTDENGVAELVVQVSNGVHRKGGLWATVMLSEQKAGFKFFATQAGIAALICGILIFLGAFNLMLFLLNHKKINSLYFGLFSVVLALRISIAGFSILTLLFPNINYSLQLKLEYTAIWLAPSLFLLLLRSLMTNVVKHRKLDYVIIGIQFTLGLISFILPIVYANQLVPVLLINAVFVLAYICYLLVYMFIKKAPGIFPYIISMLITGSGLVADILFTSKKDVLPFSMVPILLLWFALFHFLSYARKQSIMYQERLVLRDNLIKLNEAYLRFVPKEFLELLNKKSVIDVQPGDFSETEMTIMYTRVHYLNTDTPDEELSPEDQYLIFCSYLKEMSPVIKNHNGFISKFVSNGFIALFPRESSDALLCASALKKYQMENLPQINLTVAIHYGKMILGTIGEPNRLDDTVISDTVNTAARIETTAENLKQNIVLSDTAAKKISESTAKIFDIKPLGEIHVKGKKKPLSLSAWLALLICLFIRIPLSSQEFHVNKPADLAKKAISINEPWEFYWNEFVSPTSESKNPDCLVKIPSSWDTYDLAPEAKEIAKTGRGAGTYRIKITNLKPYCSYGAFLCDLCGTAFSLYVNGEFIQSSGVPAEDYKKTIADKSMLLGYFTSTQNGSLDIVLHISNNDYRVGGLWKDFKIGEERLIRNQFLSNFYQNFLFLGALLIVFIYQFSLCFYRKYDFASLFLSFFTLSILIRLVSAGFSILKFYFPNLPYHLIIRMEFTALFAGPLFFMLYIIKLYPGIFRKQIKYVPHIVVSVGTILGLLTYFLPLYYSTKLVSINEVYLLLSGSIILGKLIHRTITKHSHISRLMITSTLILLFGAFHDVLALANQPIFLPTIELIPYSFILFVFIQSAIIARQHDQAEIAIDTLSEDLKKTNSSYYRFVPREFLQLFNKHDITDVQLGEKTVKSLTIMCTDIRNFTTISESISAKDTFDLLNNYLMRIAPIIRAHGGFIEKYLGDGIIAFFPENGFLAQECAIKMQEEMKKLREELAIENKPILEIGIGLHFGNIVLGTVGDNSRMNEITISPDIDTVLYLESLTKTYKKPIIVSDSARKEWKTENMCYNFVELDKVIINDSKTKERIYALE